MQMGSKQYGHIQANDHSTLHLGDINYYGDQERLKYIPSALFNAYGLDHHACHPETRRDLLEEIKRWAEYPTGKSIFWLNGMAGMGKSTIAYTVAECLSQQGPSARTILGASFFFQRGEGGRASAVLFFPTIVHQLRRKVAGLTPLIEQAIDSDPDICGKSLGEQFDKLLWKPLQALHNTNRSPTYIIVVDAIDECNTEADIEILLRLLSTLCRGTNVRIQILLTSRPELPIRMGFADMQAHTHHDVVLHELPMPTIRQDIHTFLRDELTRIRERYNKCFPRSTPLSHCWPGDDMLERLTTMAVPLFIAATTLCRFIHDKRHPSRYDPRKRLEIVLQTVGSPHVSKIGDMYYSVLTQILPSADDATEEGQICKQFRLVVGTVVTIAEPLSMKSLAELLCVDIHAIETCLNPLHSVLWIPTDADAPVRPLHLSFGEYLCSDHLGDQRFRINQIAVHRELFRQCLQLLSRPDGLRENMCDLCFPGQLRHELPAHTVEQKLSPTIQYACRYWIYHLQLSEIKMYDQDIVHDFLRQHFLHWLEALSLLNCLGDALRYIETLQSLVSLRDSFLITTFLEDARRFVLTNRYICDRAPLQLYSSAVIFAPRGSIVRNICGKVPTWIKQCPMTPRTWGTEIQKLVGHTGTVFTVAFSPDGSVLASASADHTIRLWDAKTGQEVQRLEGHTKYASTIAFSPNGLVLASASVDQTVRLWDTKTGQEALRVEGYSGNVDAIAFSPDLSVLTLAPFDQTVRLWDTKTGEEIRRLEGHTNNVYTVAFSPDGSVLASVSFDLTVRLWDTKTGQEVRRLEGHTVDVNTVVFSPNGSVLALASEDQTVRLWDTNTGQEIQRLEGHTGNVDVIAYSPNGSMLASASEDQTVRLWDTNTGQEVLRLKGHTSDVYTVVFSPDGLVLTLASSDPTVRLWDTKTGEEVLSLEGHGSSVVAVAFSPDGSVLASASEDKTVRLWDTKTEQKVQRLEGHTMYLNTVVFSPNGSVLASASEDQTVRLWDTSTGTEVQRLEGLPSNVCAVAFSPDGLVLALPSADQAVRLWATKTGGEVRRLEGHTGNVNAVAFSPDGSVLASVSFDLTVRLWDTKTGQEVRRLEGHTVDVNTVVSSPNGSVLALSFNNYTVQLWNKKMCQEVLMLVGDASKARAVSFSPDGSVFALPSLGQAVRIWDTKTGQGIQTLDGHTGHVQAVAFSADGLMLASGSSDHTVRLWDAETGLQTHVLTDYPFIYQINFTSDGQTLLTNRGYIYVGGAPSSVKSGKLRPSNDLILKDDWIECGGRQVLWLPHEYRSKAVAFHGNTLAIGQASGLVSFLQIQYV